MSTRDKLAGTFFEARAAANGAIGRLDSMPWVLCVTCMRTGVVVAGIGIWMRRGWSRWLVVLFGALQAPIEIIYWRSHPLGGSGSPWRYCISAAVWAGFFYWYLFHKQKKAFG
jgi:hypothetical protein